MKIFYQYIRLETKRMFLSLPLTALGSVLLLSLLAGILAFCQLTSDNRQANKIHTGVVASEDEPFVDWMISAVSGMKNAEYTVTFERLDEQTANRKLQTGEITAAFLVPENYVASIINGENKHLTIRMGSGQSTIISFLFAQLSTAASSFILNSEAGIYTMQEYYALHRLPGAARDELELNLQYIQDIIALEKGIRTKTIKLETAYSSSSQYFISGLVLFLLFWGLSCSKILAPGNTAFQNQLAAAGVSQNRQLLAKWLSFFLAGLANYLLLFLLLSLGIGSGIFSLPGTATLSIEAGELWRLAFACLPLLLFSITAIMTVYEVADEAVSGALLLFFLVLASALCSGCFYPLDYLPDALQRLAPKLPVYQACRYGLASLAGTFDLPAFLCLAAYSALLYLIMAWCRSKARPS